MANKVTTLTSEVDIEKHAFAMWLNKNCVVAVSEDHWVYLKDERFYSSFKILKIYNEIIAKEKK